jgi:acyl-coenzyme A thioesterase PaaI-like protein
MEMMASAGAEAVGGGPASAATLPPSESVLPQRSPAALPAGTQLPSHYSLCIGCGADHPCGLRLRAAVGDGLRIVGQYTVTEHHQGAPGLAHGGILATVIDEVMGALNWLLMAPAVTGRLEVDFRTPVPVGATVHLEAWLTGQAGRKVYTRASGRLDAPDGPLAVEAAGLFLQVPIEHFAKHGQPQEVARAAADASSNPRRPWLEINP